MSDTLLGVVVGGAITLLATLLVQVLSNRSASGREATARQEARKDRLDEIQRATLIELHELMSEWISITLRVATKSEPRRAREAKIRRVAILTTRVRDDDLRNKLSALQKQAIGLAESEDIPQALVDLAEAWADAQVQLTTVLRSYL